jgi:hypothetical protein
MPFPPHFSNPTSPSRCHIIGTVEQVSLHKLREKTKKGANK